MLNKSRYFDIIREDVFSKNGNLLLNNYLKEFQPYAVPPKKKPYANFGEIKLLDFAMKANENLRQDRKFNIKYQQAQKAISLTILQTVPILETEVSETLGYDSLPPLLRNLTYGDSQLSVWVVDGFTYALVNAGKGESACNLLFFCRVEEPKG